MAIVKKIIKVGNFKDNRVSGAVIIPKPFLEQLGLDIGSEVEISLENNRIVIVPHTQS